MITLTITGRLCYDPETRQAGGKEVTKVTVASRYKGGLDAQTIFVDVSIWGPRGAVAKQYMKKGDTVSFVGKMLPIKIANGNAYIHLDAYDFTLPAKGSALSEPEPVKEENDDLPF
jgi:single-stranded DNA-binding protein